MAKRIALNLETDLCKAVMAYHSCHPFLAALNNALVFSHHSQSAAAVQKEGGSSLSSTAISNTNSVKSSLAEPTEIIILSTAFLICVNVGSCTYRRKDKSDCDKGDGCVTEW